MAKKNIIIAVGAVLALPVLAYLVLLTIGLSSIWITDGGLMDKKPVFTEQGIINGYNHERSLKGLAPLKQNALLDKSACAKSDDMDKHNYYAHVSPEGVDWKSFVDNAGYDWQNVGENLIVGATSNEDAVKSWMESPDHRANILGDYEDIGVCFKRTKVVVHLGKEM